MITIAHPEQSSGELKKKMLQGTSAYCVLLGMKQVTYKGSTVIPTSSSLEMIQVLWAFFPENRDKSVEVSAEINGSLISGILGPFSGGKIQHLTI